MDDRLRSFLDAKLNADVSRRRFVQGAAGLASLTVLGLPGQAGAADGKLGGELNFWKVAIRPGKPFVFGQLGGKFLFGLPGNPVSAFVTFLLLVRPALRRWQGAREVNLPIHSGILGEEISNPGERRHFVRVKVNENSEVFSTGTQASHLLASLAGANGLLDVSPRTTLPAGSMVRVLRIH